MRVKIIRRAADKGYRSGVGEFYPQRLEAVELEYAPNRALRLTREELSEVVAALQSDLEYRDGVIRLLDAFESE